MAKHEKIPKVIHYFWFGHNKKPRLIQKCIRSWKKACPDYQIIEWNEDNFDVNMIPYTKEAYSLKKWGFVSDYARLWVIFNYGGFYLDTDVELIKSLDSLRDEKVFFSSEDNQSVSTGLGFGAIKGSAIVGKLADDYKNRHFIGKDKKPDLTPCPIIQTEYFRKNIDSFSLSDKISSFDGISFYPKDYFCPIDPSTNKLHITENTIGIHYFAASWQKKSLRLKRVLIDVPKTRIYNAATRILGEEKINAIKRKRK